MSLLKIEKLSITVQSNVPNKRQVKCLLKPISFELNKTERLVILGQTGAGKSLIVQAIMGTLPEQLSSHGELYLFGQLIENKVTQRSLWGTKISFPTPRALECTGPANASWRPISKNLSMGGKIQP